MPNNIYRPFFSKGAGSWLVLAKPSCPAFLSVKINMSGQDMECLDYNAKAVKLAVQDPHISLVVIPDLGEPYLSVGPHASHYERDGTIHITSELFKGSEADIAKAGLEKTVGILLNAKKKVVLIVDEPELPFDIDSCVRDYIKNSFIPSRCILTRQQYENRTKLYRQMLSDVKEKYPSVLIYNNTSFFCNSKTCQFLIGNRSLYRDTDHLSVFGSKLAGGEFIDWLKANRLFN